MIDTIVLAHRVNGRVIPGQARFEQVNPADPTDLRVTGPEADAAVMGDAVAAARAAVEALDRQGIEARSDSLAAVGHRLKADAPQLALLIARETGKTLNDARGEVLRAGRLFDFFAAETLRNVGEVFDSVRRGTAVEVTNEPIGVVAAITPWNFPVAIPAWKIAPALAFGNAVVWKPSEYSSATAAALMEIIAAAGLPAGAVNLVLGAGAAGQALCEAPGIDAVSFTGSVATGAKVRMAGAERSLRLQLEMGGVNGMIVLADADLGNSVACALNGAFFAAGQRCTATSRIIVEEAIADRFVAALKERMASLAIGDPREASTQVGPLVSMRQKELITRQVASVEESGLRPVVGGTATTMKHAFFAPTLFDAVPVEHAFGMDEIFGPVAGIYRVRNFDEAIAVLNAPRYRLSAGLCTTSLSHATAFRRRASAGLTMVNVPTAGIDYHAPFGGVGGSSYGPREQGRAARAFYTVMKTSYICPG
ncbi:MAG: aldehyde dehydrogenase family protein [Alphaproteobacteria bacterium]|nr:aldehyde dehydrogenase family protein [Alphaproteobacteria bacterium]